MSGSSITIQVRGEAMKFAVDANTQVEARGAGTKTRQLAATGKPGPEALSDILTVGQPVAVTYSGCGGTPRASMIRAVPSVGTGGSVSRGLKCDRPAR